jgi:HK97 family phage major capsid protein
VQYLKELVKERDSLANQIMSMADSAAKEERNLSEQENASIDKMKATLDARDTELRRWSEVQKSVANFATIDDAAAEKRAAETRKAELSTASFGRQFVDSAEYRGYGGVGSSGRVVADGYLETRAPILTTTFPGTPRVQEVPGVNLVHSAPLTSLIPTINTTAGSVKYPVRSGAAPLAAIVPEGQPKPEATVAVAWVEAAIPTIAHWVQFARQFKDDEPAIMSYIEGELRWGVIDKIETEIAANLNGVATAPVTAATLIEAIRIGMGAVSAAGGNPGVLLANPADAAALDMAIFNTGGVGALYGANVWGLRVITANAITAGTPLVLDPRAAVVYQRSGVELLMTDSDIVGAGATAVSGFRSNILTLLAEARALPTVQQPALVQPVEATAGVAASSSGPVSKKS